MKLKVNYESELLNYLYENLNMPKKKIKSLLVHGNVYVNSTKTTAYNYKLLKGSEIIIDNKHKKNLLFDILYEDKDIIVVNKPSGLLTISTAKEKEKTLYHYVRQYLNNNHQRVFIVHRLDKDTSGIVIFAKNLKMKNKLQNNWDKFVNIREYKAVVHGKLTIKSDCLVDFLSETKTNLVYVSKTNKGNKAVTNYKVLKENDAYSLLDIKIETGRKNQIRVQLSNIGHPIVGDNKYGLKKKDASRLYLHANKIELFHPNLNKTIVFETNIPKEFKQII